MFKKKKYLISGIILVLVLGYLGFTALQHSATYYYTVDEFLSDSSARIEENVRVSGKVVPGTIREDGSTNNLLFTISQDESSLPILYAGVLPDAFKEDNDVVVEGNLAEDGTFIAHTISVKCPSKYTEEE